MKLIYILDQDLDMDSIQTKIKKFLLRQDGVTIRTESSTKSIYFNIDGLIAIRLSNHLGFDTFKHLHIIIPYNSTTHFIIFLNNRSIIIENYTKLKEYIKNYILTFKLISAKDLENNIEETINKTIEKTIINSVSKLTNLNTDELELTTLYRLIHPDYYKGIIHNLRLLSQNTKSIKYQKSH